MHTFQSQPQKDKAGGCFVVGVLVTVAGAGLWWGVDSGWIMGAPLSAFGLWVLLEAFKIIRTNKKIQGNPTYGQTPTVGFLDSLIGYLGFLVVAGTSLFVSVKTGRGWVITIPIVAFTALAWAAPMLYFVFNLFQKLVQSFRGGDSGKPERRVVRQGSITPPFVIQVTSIMRLNVFMVGGILLGGQLPKTGWKFVNKRTGKSGTIDLVTSAHDFTNATAGNRVVFVGDAQTIGRQVTFSTRDMIEEDVHAGDILEGQW